MKHAGQSAFAENECIYTHIRCLAKEKRRLKLADSIKMLIPPARIVQIPVPRCLFLVFPLVYPFSNDHPESPWCGCSLTEFLEQGGGNFARQSEGDKTGIDSHRQEDGTWTTSASTIASSCAMLPLTGGGEVRIERHFEENGGHCN